MTLSLAMKKPLPREIVPPRASKVSMATAEGLMRLTSSGRKSCAAALKAQKHKIVKRRKVLKTDFIFRLRFLLGIIEFLSESNKFLRKIKRFRQIRCLDRAKPLEVLLN